MMMQPTPENVKAFIESQLDCTHIEVTGDGQHFEAVIVSPVFEGKSRIARHQAVYAALGDRMKAQIHALSMRTLAPSEWIKPGD